MAKKAGKSKRGSNSTDGCMAMPVMPRERNRRNVEIRQISNGYVLTESGVRNGQYYSRETFSPSQPKVQIAPTKRD